VLVGLANHAGPDGTAAFPSVVTLVRYTGLSERTVRTCLDRLAAEGIISPCDPGIVAARIKRADRRPQGWDLNLSLIRDDLTEADLAALGHHFPGLAARVAVVACPDAGGAAKPPAASCGPDPGLARRLSFTRGAARPAVAVDLVTSALGAAWGASFWLAGRTQWRPWIVS
jgi:hypothetical protein